MAKTWALDDRAQLHKDANEALDQNLAPGEAVLVIIRGMYDSALIATARRVFIFKKGMFSGATLGKKLASWDYRNLSGVQIETGMISGAVALQGAGIAGGDLGKYRSGGNDPLHAPHAVATNREHFEQARLGVARLRELIAQAQTVAPADAAPDVADQLRKLGELRDLGILTAAEFDAKKVQLLSRL